MKRFVDILDKNQRNILISFPTSRLENSPFAFGSSKMQFFEAVKMIDGRIDLLAILQKSLDRALSLYIFIHGARSSGVRASIAIMDIRKFYKM